jgi:flagellar basal-body rod protein FlgF
MENTMYIAVSRQAALRRQLDVTANNVANMNTTAFKAERILFESLLVPERATNGGTMAFARDVASVRDTSEGAFVATGNPLDLAIRGDGLLTVTTAAGERYTRNGGLRLDEQGQLVTQHGHPVSAVGGGPITLGPTDTRITISRDGVVSSENGELGRLRIVRFDDPQIAEPVAEGLMASSEPPREVERPEVEQGMLESANVQPIAEMARMIDVQRSYDQAKRLIDAEDDRIRRMIEAYAR